MSFADELAKLARTRRAYVRFARELNPVGTWAGSQDRQYAKTPDGRGEIPVVGSVESLGTFNNFIANHEFPVEVPSIKTTLFDPTNEWRAMAARPSTMILNRRLGYYVRQHDDADTILDQLIAVGQIGTPTFPPGKVSFDLTVPGGDFLGETVGRRLLTTRDWPRSLPDDRGKVIPFVYGALTNTVQPLILGMGGSGSGTTNVCGTTRLATSFAGGNNGPAFDDGEHYIRVPFNFGEPFDAAHPAVISSEGLRVRTGLGPNGENVVDGYYPSSYGGPLGHYNSGPPDYQDWGAAGIAFGMFGPLYTDAPDEDLQKRGAFPADFGCVSADLTFSPEGINQIVYCPFFTVNTRAYQNSVRITTAIDARGYFPEAPQGSGRWGPPYVINLEWYGFNSGGNYVESQSFNSDAELTAAFGNWTNWQLKWKCGTPTLAADGSFTDVASDGYIQLWAGSQLIVSATGCDLWFQDAWFGQVGLLYPPDAGNVGNGVWLGYYGMFGMATNFKVQSGLFANYSEQGLIDGAGSTLACVDTTDGASDQGGAGRGGYLKALLVDTGGGSPLTDYPSPTLTATLQPQPHAAPTLTGILQAGGSGYVGVTHYYAIATVHGGVLSELSNVVGPFTTTDSERSVLLDFSGLASGADAIRLYRGNSPDFSQFSLYRFNDFGASDIPAGNPSVLDEFPGIDTRENTGFDPHWDLRYRQTKYYSVSALYADGVESACSAWVEVQLQPRNAPLSVEITIIPPPSGVAAVVSYTVRRMNRTYHWETALDRQWSVLPS